MVRDGEKVPDDEAQILFRMVRGNEYTVFRYDKPIGKGTFRLDATRRPRTIDATPEGRAPLLGIYDFDGDRLRNCFAPAGKPRPVDFSAREGSGHTLTVWERQKK